ncbi:MAG: serine/threonine-protein kinase [Planctomycetota bacterium]
MSVPDPDPVPERSPERGPKRAAEPPSIPGYEVDAVIGRGASGVVYRARQLAVDREVALKVLLPELSRSPRIVQRLKREARTTARLAHPNVISAIDMGEVDGRWWYAMELVEGGTLAQLVKRSGRLEERQALGLFIPLVGALAHLAEHGVVHRDIKPANILIDERTGLARLADLGLAFADDDPDKTRSGTLGTPAFMAPEQAIDSGSADVQSDLWSLGATMFHAVCGRPPFGGASAAEVLTEVLHAEVPDPLSFAPDLSNGFALVLRKCLTRDRDQRYGSAAELAADLERVRERRAPHVRRSQLVMSPRERDRRRAVLIALACVAFFVVGGTLLRVLTRAAAGGEEVATHADYVPLISLEERVARGDASLLAQQLRELERLRAEAPVSSSGQLIRVSTELYQSLRAEVHALRRQTEHAVDAALERNDFVAARAALDEVDTKLVRRTGFKREELEAHSVLLRLSAEERDVQQRLEVTLRAVAGAARAWVGEARLDAQRAFEREEWRAAWKRIDLSRDELLRLLGFADYRFPKEALDDVLLPIEVELRLERQKLRDRWTSVDRGLIAALDEATAKLERDLETHVGGVFDAASDLARNFERLLVARKIAPEELPEAFSFRAPAELTERIARLRAAEERRLESDVAALFRDVVSIERRRFQRRDFASVAETWSEVARATERELGHPESEWRAHQRRLARSRALGARRLQDLLDRAAERVRALDGQTIELALGGIPRRGTIVAGVDPRKGFRFVDELGQERRFEPATLPLRALERLLELRRPSELNAEERLDYALLLAADAEHERAAEVLGSGPVPREGALGELFADLSARVEAARERGLDRARSRASEAAELLERVFEDHRHTHAPASVLTEVEDLLDQYGDIQGVRDRRSDLLRLRDELRGDGGRPGQESFTRVYPDAVVRFPQPHRAELKFDLTRGRLPRAWRAGEWRFDGIGWSDPKPAAGWEDLATSNGPRVVLSAPLAWTTEGFRVVLDLARIGNEPAQCCIVSIGGFHVALAEGLLPGAAEFRPRWLVTGGDLADLIRRLGTGEGRQVPELFGERAAFQLVLEGSISGGWLTLELDGRELGSSRNLRSEADPPYALELRTWEPMRLMAMTIEAGR